MASYSFLDVNATIVGIGGVAQLGQGAGAAEEGISIAMIDEKNTMTVGADGAVMHSLHASKAAKITVRLLKTSPTNQILSQMYNLQTSSSALHGKNVLLLNNLVGGDSYSCFDVAFAKFPDNVYAKDGKDVEWEFHAGTVDPSLGGGLLNTLLSAVNL